MTNSRLDPEVQQQGMWCHLCGFISTLLWILFWAFAVLCNGICLIAPFLILMRIQADKDLQAEGAWTQPLEACSWVIPLFMLLLGPLVTFVNWLHNRDFDPFVDAQGKESVNFQFTASICSLLTLIFFNLYLFQTSQSRGSLGIPTGDFWIGLLVAIGFFSLLTVLHIALTILAASKAAKGQNYRYPFTVRFLK